MGCAEQLNCCIFMEMVLTISNVVQSDIIHDEETLMIIEAITMPYLFTLHETSIFLYHVNNEIYPQVLIPIELVKTRFEMVMMA